MLILYYVNKRLDVIRTMVLISASHYTESLIDPFFTIHTRENTMTNDKVHLNSMCESLVI